MAQWLDRVKYGSGKNGSPAVSGTINTYAACTGTATQTSLTTALAASAGDVILIHQSRGTGAGQWELNYVLSDAGATLTLAYPLAYSYATGAQAIIVPQYTGGTLSGALTCTAWGGTSGGIVALMSNGDLTVSGSASVNNAGFRKGTGSTSNTNSCGLQGEGYTAYGGISGSANTSGGGGGYNVGTNGGGGGGAGGGNAAAGSNGGVSGSNDERGGTGGTSSGNAGLTTLLFGGGGGQGGGDDTGNAGARPGGNGGGIILIFAKNITLSGTFSLNGENGTGTGENYEGGGGGGAGGSCLIKCQKAVLGTNKITVNAGTGGAGTSGGNGGNGSVGRIHVDYSDSLSGTTTPTLDSTQTTTLKVQLYGGII